MDTSRRDFLATSVTAAGAAAARRIAATDDRDHDHSRRAVTSEDVMIRTRLTERFAIKHPILCAPIAYVTGGQRAAAVSRGGGLGIVARGFAGTMAAQAAELLHNGG